MTQKIFFYQISRADGAGAEPSRLPCDQPSISRGGVPFLHLVRFGRAAVPEARSQVFADQERGGIQNLLFRLGMQSQRFGEGFVLRPTCLARRNPQLVKGSHHLAVFVQLCQADPP